MATTETEGRWLTTTAAAAAAAAAHHRCGAPPVGTVRSPCTLLLLLLAGQRGELALAQVVELQLCRGGVLPLPRLLLRLHNHLLDVCRLVQRTPAALSLRRGTPGAIA
jgi:hypothetical protein